LIICFIFPQILFCFGVLVDQITLIDITNQNSGYKEKLRLLDTHYSTKWSARETDICMEEIGCILDLILYYCIVQGSGLNNFWVVHIWGLIIRPKMFTKFKKIQKCSPFLVLWELVGVAQERQESACLVRTLKI